MSKIISLFSEENESSVRAHQSAEGEGVGSEATRQCCTPRAIWQQPQENVGVGDHRAPSIHTQASTVCAFLVRLRDNDKPSEMANESPNARQEALARVCARKSCQHQPSTELLFTSRNISRARCWVFDKNSRVRGHSLLSQRDTPFNTVLVLSLSAACVIIRQHLN
jgi:hypothetical protein